jgi:hypothetical protein
MWHWMLTAAAHAAACHTILQAASREKRMNTQHTLMLLLLAVCMLAASQPAVAHAGAHPHHNRKQQQRAVTSPEIEVAAFALLSTSRSEPPEMPAATETDVIMASTNGTAAAPINGNVTKRMCGTSGGSRSQRAAAERDFKQRLQRLKESGQDVSAAQAQSIVIQEYFHVLMFNSRVAG